MGWKKQINSLVGITLEVTNDFYRLAQLKIKEGRYIYVVYYRRKPLYSNHIYRLAKFQYEKLRRKKNEV